MNDVTLKPGSPIKLARTVTAGERLRGWLAGLSPNTGRAYLGDLLLFARHLGHHPVVDKSEIVARAEKERAVVAGLEDLCTTSGARALRVLEEWRDQMKDAGVASATINRRLSAVNTALRQIAKAEDENGNPIGPGRLDIELVKAEPRNDTKGPSPHWVTLVVDRLAKLKDENDKALPIDPETATRDLAVILLAAQRGLRRSEIADLRIGDVDVEKGQIRVRRKGKREKVALDIAGASVEALRRWLAVRPDVAKPEVEDVFVATGNRSRGDGIGPHAIWAIVRNAGRMVGAVWHPHDLRHTAITEALRLCHNSLAVAQEFAGHAAPQTTSRYLDDKARLQREAVAEMAKLYELPT